MACCFSLCPGRRRFELNQEKNKVFLSDMKAATSGSLSQWGGQVSVCLIADSIFQVQVLGIEQNFNSLSNSPKQGWEQWVLPSCLLPSFIPAAENDVAQLFFQISNNSFHVTMIILGFPQRLLGIRESTNWY